MRRIATLALVLGALCCLPAAARAGNLFVNSNFQEPAVPSGRWITFGIGDTIDGWEVVGEPGNVTIFSSAFTEYGLAFPAEFGTQFLDLTGINSQTATGVQQTVATTPGASYRLSFYVGNVADRKAGFFPAATVNVSMDGTLLLSATNRQGKGLNTQVWRKFAVTIVATGATTTFAFINGSAATENDCGLEGIILRLVPPATGAAAE